MKTTRHTPEALFYGFACLTSALLATWLCLSFFSTLAVFYLTLLAGYDARAKRVLMRDAFASCLLLALCIPHDDVSYVYWIGLATITFMLAFKGYLGRFIGSIDVILFGLGLSTLPAACFQSFFISTGLFMLILYALTRQRHVPFIVPLWASYIGHLGCMGHLGCIVATFG